MKNRYKGKCEVCGYTVLPNMGTIEKIGRKFRVTHLDCQKVDNSVPDVDALYEEQCASACGLGGTQQMFGY